MTTKNENNLIYSFTGTLLKDSITPGRVNLKRKD